jgi:hypothetical protein
LVAYYLLIPFAIGGLFVMRHRHLPILPMLATLTVTLTVAIGFPITLPRTVRCRDSVARRLRD